MTGPGRYLGLISGTSIDGIDAALVSIAEDGRIDATLKTHTHAVPDDQAARIRAVGPDTPLAQLADLDAELGDAFAEAALATCPEPARVHGLGCHGQTVWHAPDRVPPATIQLGDPNRIASRTGIPTVADFRRRDVAEGGEGAPLAPAFHQACLASPAERRVVLNLGGIANVSLLEPDRSPRGFDTGPANTLLDHWIRRHQGQTCDIDGAWAATGTVDTGLLERLLRHPFLDTPPPKSTGPEAFHLAWLDTLGVAERAPEDVQATLAEFTARSVADGLALTGRPRPDRVLVCGGGAHNGDLMARLRRCMEGVSVESTAVLGLDPDYVEAVGFAWLAWARLNGRPSNCPAATGARAAVSLGGIYAGH